MDDGTNAMLRILGGDLISCLSKRLLLLCYCCCTYVLDIYLISHVQDHFYHTTHVQDTIPVVLCTTTGVDESSVVGINHVMPGRIGPSISDYHRILSKFVGICSRIPSQPPSTKHRYRLPYAQYRYGGSPGVP